MIKNKIIRICILTLIILTFSSNVNAAVNYQMHGFNGTDWVPVQTDGNGTIKFNANISSISWNNVIDMPSGFSDNIDNTGPTVWELGANSMYNSSTDFSLGIGTIPTSNLHVIGNSNITGLTYLGNLETNFINTTHILDGTILPIDLTSTLDIANYTAGNNIDITNHVITNLNPYDTENIVFYNNSLLNNSYAQIDQAEIFTKNVTISEDLIVTGNSYLKDFVFTANASFPDSITTDYIFENSLDSTKINNLTVLKDIRVLGNSYLGTLVFDANGTFPDSVLTDYIFPESSGTTLIDNITILKDIRVLGNSYLGSFTIEDDLVIGSNNFSSTNVGIGTSSPSGVNNFVTLNLKGTVASYGSQSVLESTDGEGFVSLYSGGGTGDNPSIIYNQDLRFGNGTKNVALYDERMRLTEEGNLGINTTAPLAKLQVDGSIFSYATQTDNVFSGSVGVNNANFIGSGGYWALRTNIANAFNIDTYNGGSPIAAMTILQNGNVGIGTTGPQTELHMKSGGTGVNETLRLQGATGTVGEGPLIRFTNTHASGDNPNSGEYNLAGIAAYGQGWAGRLAFYTPNSGDTGGADLVERMTIIEDGNVGIGTTSPTAKLDVWGITNITDIADSTTSTLTIGGQQPRNTHLGTFAGDTYFFNNYHFTGGHTSDDSGVGSTGLSFSPAGISFEYAPASATPSRVVAMYVSNESGNVGIGTTSPISDFQVTDSGTNSQTFVNVITYNDQPEYTNAIYLRKSNSDTEGTLSETQNGDIIGSIEWYGVSSSAAWSGALATIGVNQTSAAGSSYIAGDITFGTSTNAAANTEKMRITSTGNVGIGTTNPDSKLDIVGTAGTIPLEVNAGDGTTTTIAAKGVNTGGASFITAGNSDLTDFVTLYGGTSGNQEAAIWWDNGHTGMKFGTASTVVGADESIKMSILNSGNVGIGTTSPGNGLEVNTNPSSDTSQVLFHNPYGGNGVSVLNLAHDFTVGQAPTGNFINATGDMDGTPVDLFLVTDVGGGYFAGNVGIGTTGPGDMLHINDSGALTYDAGNYQDQNLLTLQNTAGTNYFREIRFTNGANQENFIGVVQDSNGYGDFFFKSYNGAYGERMRITSGGNVGIGTTSPTMALSVTTSTDQEGIRINNTAQSPVMMLESGIANAAARNWDLVTNNFAMGDFAIRRSTAAGGIPATGSFTINATGGIDFDTSGIPGFSAGCTMKLDANGGVYC